jgi:hypothetical protein
MMLAKLTTVLLIKNCMVDFFRPVTLSEDQDYLLLIREDESSSVNSHLGRI